MKRFAGKGVFPHQLAFTLLIPLRNIFLSPKQLILKTDSKVLEVGPGPGYFSAHVAKAIPKGKLVLADIQQEMLDKASKRITGKKLNNVEYYLCNGDIFTLPDECFDIIFMVTVIGEIENKNAYIKEFFRMLRKGGILSISEAKGDPDMMTVEEVKELVAPFGFEFYQVFGNKRNYTINFRK